VNLQAMRHNWPEVRCAFARPPRSRRADLALQNSSFADRRNAKGIEYSRLTALLIEAVKEQQMEITELQRKLQMAIEQNSH
jgi:hypothetical protein